MKGKKTCPKCEELNGCRSLSCKNCNHKFLTSKSKPKPQRRRIKRRKRWEEIDWTELQKGDTIKVVQGSGPYYINKEGETTSFGYHGKFTVKWLDEDGIHALGKHGHSFLYMGEEKEGITGTFLRKYKFMRKITYE